MPEETQRRSLLLGIAERIVSFLAVFALAFIWIGTTRQKVQQKVGTLETEVHTLKEDVKKLDEQVNRMDLKGSTSFHTFVETYRDEQGKQYEHLKTLQTEVNHLENMKYRIERLEQERKPNAQR